MAEEDTRAPAALPREQVGPFLLLGLDKHADAEAIEAHWAERLKWARRQQVAVALEDINWAREILRDAERRLRADVASLNADLEDGLLARLAERFAAGAGAVDFPQPIDEEPELLPGALSDVEAMAAGMEVPAIPEEYPAALQMLREFVAQPIDPWAFTLPAEPHAKDPPP